MIVIHMRQDICDAEMRSSHSHPEGAEKEMTVSKEKEKRKSKDFKSL